MVIYVGPLEVYKIMDRFQYILMDIEGKILNGIFNFNRLKQIFLRTVKDQFSTLAQLK